MLIPALIYGVIRGVILTLSAIGFNLTFGISGLPNFAYGALYILAGYIMWFFLTILGFPYSLSMVVSVLFNILLGGLIYRFCLLHVRGQIMSEVIVTFGVGLVILEVTRYITAINPRMYQLPTVMDISFLFLNVYFDLQRIIVLGIGIFLFLCLRYFTRHNKIGLAFRGIAQNELTSISLGINSDWIGALSMAFGSGLAAIAAVTIIPLGALEVNEGYEMLLNALLVCIIGGLGSNIGVVVAGLVVGMAQQLTDLFIGSEWIMVVGLGAIIVILLVKPSGLFGKQKELEERV
jgi:branched-chain amino acid transport system permease protein